ncbi:hypothetical protein COLO4_33730 [Corchorus olitorius]|uniref:Uncharacterized protein n=1 Tax=Corchorus olitorius TaxID=93759 RepID=A0A1R3GS01_9ROSI|nr:hypothetical protein COLO4_33730 [Corchorus olitorius]
MLCPSASTVSPIREIFSQGVSNLAFSSAGSSIICDTYAESLEVAGRFFNYLLYICRGQFFKLFLLLVCNPYPLPISYHFQASATVARSAKGRNTNSTPPKTGAEFGCKKGERISSQWWANHSGRKEEENNSRDSVGFHICFLKSYFFYSFSYSPGKKMETVVGTLPHERTIFRKVLMLLYDSKLQWRFANVRADATFMLQKLRVEIGMK